MTTTKTGFESYTRKNRDGSETRYEYFHGNQGTTTRKHLRWEADSENGYENAGPTVTFTAAEAQEDIEKFVRSGARRDGR